MMDDDKTKNPNAYTKIEIVGEMEIIGWIIMALMLLALGIGTNLTRIFP